MSRIVIGSDHGGVELKETIKNFLEEKGVEVRDMGALSNDSVDYPDFGVQVAGAVSRGEAERGILICGTGIGMSIVANKFPGVRAALVNDEYTARMSREHNDANVMVLGGRVVSPEIARAMAGIWLETPFEGGRHQRRLDKIAKLEADIRDGKD